MPGYEYDRREECEVSGVELSVYLSEDMNYDGGLRMKCPKCGRSGRFHSFTVEIHQIFDAGSMVEISKTQTDIYQRVLLILQRQMRKELRELGCLSCLGKECEQ